MSTDGKDRPSPAYVALPSLKSLLSQFKEHGVPDQVDRSVMHSFSGGTQSHLMSSLKFLGLLDANNVPTDTLRRLVDAVGTNGWAFAFRSVIESSYLDVLGEVNIASATPQQVENKFRLAGLEGSTLDKAMRFYVQSLRECEITHSPHLGRRRSTGSRRPSQRRTSDRQTEVFIDAHSETRKQHNPPPETDMISFPIHLPGKPMGKIIVPDTITTAECKMLAIYMQAIEAYAAQRETAKS